jgi:2-isopropylmalate synthase
MIADTVAYLKSKGREVFFDAEHFFDGYKESAELAMGALAAAAKAGADALVLCDTNGGSLPHEVFAITSEVVRSFKVPVAIHAHNDMGMAAANSVEAVRAGAVQVQGTVNGYGERCGNANLCSIVPALQLKLGIACVSKANLAKLRELSLFADDLVNRRPDPAAPFVGQQAFAHKGGAHVHAVQKAPETYEHIDPAVVGNERHILISELSGGSNVLMKAIEMGVDRIESADGAREVLSALKALEAKGYAFEAADASFRILVQKVLKQHRSFFELQGYRVVVEKRRGDAQAISEATVKLKVGDAVEHTVAEGDGPVNALDKALRKALGRFYPEISNVTLTDFRVRILDPEESTAAKTRVLIESSDGEESWGTVGVSGNIIEASWEALVDSVEYKLFREEQKGRKRSRTGRGKAC